MTVGGLRTPHKKTFFDRFELPRWEFFVLFSNKGRNRECSQPYISETELIHQLLQYVRLEKRIETSTELISAALEYRDIVAHVVDKHSLDEDTSDPFAVYTE